MRKMPKKRHPLSTLSNNARQLLKRSASAMGRQSFLPKALRKRLNKLGQPKRPNPSNNRRKKTTPELQEYIKSLQDNNTEKRIIRDFRELAHYAYVFDIDHYKSQLKAEEANSLRSIGDVIHHYCASGYQEGIDPSDLFDTDNYFSKYPDVKASAVSYTHLTLPTNREV